MKGAPFRDFCLVFLCFMLLLIPLRLLTRSMTAPVDAEPGAESSADSREAWLDLRFSHAPTSVKVFQNGELLVEGGGALRMDADIRLSISEARSALQLEFRWSEGQEQAYVDLRLEPDGMAARSLGFWTQGNDSRTWNLSWEDVLE